MMVHPVAVMLALMMLAGAEMAAVDMAVVPTEVVEVAIEEKEAVVVTIDGNQLTTPVNVICIAPALLGFWF